MLRTILAILGIIFAIGIIYFVFFHKGSPPKSIPLNVNLEEIKPPGWKPYDEKNGLVMINIDHDAEPEWLFLYWDEYSTHQIGGVIYDAQSRPRNEFSIPVASQAPTYLIPYKLLPDYPPSKNRGYLGDNAVEYQAVGSQDVRTPTRPPSGTATPSPNIASGDRLLVRGKFNNLVNRFSLFWWVSPEYGYSGALAYTPGWFSLSDTNPQDWNAWKDHPLGITQLWAWEPQMDRSNICRVALWKLESGPNPPITWHFTAMYDESYLRFCRGDVPSEPAFPEGQVMAYLFDMDARRWKGGAGPLPRYNNVRVYNISEPEITDQPFDHPVAPVDVDFWASDGFHSMRWVLEMIPPATVKDPVRWRIQRAENR